MLKKMRHIEKPNYFKPNVHSDWVWNFDKIEVINRAINKPQRKDSKLLWLSSVDEEDLLKRTFWEQWCESEGINWLSPIAYDFTIDMSLVATVDISIIKGFTYHNELGNKAINFEKLKNQYSGFYVTQQEAINYRFNSPYDMDFYAWDCESAAIWDSCCIEKIEEVYLKRHENK